MKSLLRIVWRIVLYCAIFFFVSTFLAALYYKYKPVEYTPLMFIRSMEHTSDGERPRIKHEWVPLEEMSPQLPIAVIASEDQKFMQHNGFDVEAIEQARAEAEAGKRVRGASTISQQTAKNVFLWPSSTWVRKGFEVYFTFLIETLWSKERIMEVYLNSIEMGDGIYGAQAVANEHFGYDASKLTSADCALIAATLPNPREYSSKNPSKYMRKRQRWILKQMKTVKFSCENDEK